MIKEEENFINFINEDEIKLFKSVNKVVFEKLKTAGLLNIRHLAAIEIEDLIEIGLTKDRGQKIINFFLFFRSSIHLFFPFYQLLFYYFSIFSFFFHLLLFLFFSPFFLCFVCFFLSCSKFCLR
jgi:hypothetical protein